MIASGKYKNIQVFELLAESQLTIDSFKSRGGSGVKNKLSRKCHFITR